MNSSLKYLIIFGVVYVAFKAYLFYRLNKTMREFADKVAKEKRPPHIEANAFDARDRAASD